ncbi:nucleoside deaminase [Hoeflea sp. YIM 152468]|uniref:nucleoside deaminase n=1 Tax=Hoeflea sp. YIM 152468 TaxID=3031759 RepID=UPI0023DCA3DA|nr:nucleoside deaminase [Hoeflea sp. YIM 152468]MDF1609016.1 nucleoside deaminase [Hoeflea sp. YIM 152468]
MEIIQNADLVRRLLDVMQHDIVPLTETGVAAGNKIFGGALVRKADLSLVMAQTNNETDNPLWHGEVHLLKCFYESPIATSESTKDMIFLSTHEPCTMCMSAIAWAGFDNFFYFFSHQDSRDSFAIPHDLKMLKEVFGLEPGGYNHDNAFWHGRGIFDIIATLPDAEAQPLLDQAQQIRNRYADLSAAYQSGKDSNAIPLN